MTTRPRRNEPCPCGSGLKYKRCCLNRDHSASGHASQMLAGQTSPGVELQAPSSGSSLAIEMTIILDTGAGRAIRRVPTARPLPGRGHQGREAEAATADAASLWGLPDFVYRAGAQPTASGVDEIGDRLLVVGDTGVVVQVKSREVLTDDTAKEGRWIVKHTRKAVRQARGTVRALTS